MRSDSCCRLLSNLDSIRGRAYAPSPDTTVAQAHEALRRDGAAGANATLAAPSPELSATAPALAAVRDVYLAGYRYGFSVRSLAPQGADAATSDPRLPHGGYSCGIACTFQVNTVE
jgi:hypothetical protein